MQSVCFLLEEGLCENSWIFGTGACAKTQKKLYRLYLMYSKLQHCYLWNVCIISYLSSTSSLQHWGCTVRNAHLKSYTQQCLILRHTHFDAPNSYHHHHDHHQCKFKTCFLAVFMAPTSGLYVSLSKYLFKYKNQPSSFSAPCWLL